MINKNLKTQFALKIKKTDSNYFLHNPLLSANKKHSLSDSDSECFLYEVTINWRVFLILINQYSAEKERLSRNASVPLHCCNHRVLLPSLVARLKKSKLLPLEKSPLLRHRRRSIFLPLLPVPVAQVQISPPNEKRTPFGVLFVGGEGEI